MTELLNEIREAQRMLGVVAFWLTACAFALGLFVVADSAWRRRARRRMAKEPRDYAVWCFGGPLDGEQHLLHSPPSVFGSEGEYRYCVDHQRFEWRQRSRKWAP